MPAAGETKTDARADGLAKWLKDNGVHLRGARIAPSPRGGIGVIASEPLTEGAVLFTLPDALVLRPHGALGEVLAHAGISGWAALALTIASELALGDDSLWAGYLCFLPAAGDSLLHLPMLWEPDELTRLQGTGVPMRASAEAVRDFHEEVAGPFAKLLPEHFPGGLSLPVFARCGAIVSAYAFNFDGGSDAMVPAADALNADGPDRASARLEHRSNGTLEMVVTRPVASGDELLNTYGALAESEALLRHGYIGTDSGPESGATAICVREMCAQVDPGGGGVPMARMKVALKELRKAGVVVRAAPRGARPFMDAGDVLPLAHLDEACDEMRRKGLAPAEVVGKVLENRLKLLRKVDEGDSGVATHRAELARRLRAIDGPRLQKALDYIANIT